MRAALEHMVQMRVRKVCELKREPASTADVRSMK